MFISILKIQLKLCTTWIKTLKQLHYCSVILVNASFVCQTSSRENRIKANGRSKNNFKWVNYQTFIVSVVD